MSDTLDKVDQVLLCDGDEDFLTLNEALEIIKFTKSLNELVVLLVGLCITLDRDGEEEMDLITSGDLVLASESKTALREEKVVELVCDALGEDSAVAHAERGVVKTDVAACLNERRGDGHKKKKNVDLVHLLKTNRCLLLFAAMNNVIASRKQTERLAIINRYKF